MREGLTNVILVTSNLQCGHSAGFRCSCQTLGGDTMSAPTSAISKIDIPANCGLKVSYAAYDSRASGDISFDRFALIAVDEVVDASWAKGTIVMDNGKRVGKSGLFPLNHVLELPVLRRAKAPHHLPFSRYHKLRAKRAPRRRRRKPSSWRTCKRSWTTRSTFEKAKSFESSHSAPTGARWRLMMDVEEHALGRS